MRACGGRGGVVQISLDILTPTLKPQEPLKQKKKKSAK